MQVRKGKIFAYLILYLYCLVSHEVPEHPVVSPSSGNIFERNLIVKYIEDHGVDPINGEALSVEQLIPLKGIDINY